MLVKSVLEAQIMTALHDAFKATFLYGAADEGERMATSFAKTAAPKLASAIDSYIKSATILGGNVTTAGSPTAQAGPITVPPKIT